MTVAVDPLIAKAQKLIRDQTGVRWSTDELIDYLNDGQREVVILQPKAGSKNTNYVLSAGTKQTIPSDGVQLLRVIRNMGVGGATPGKAIREVDREVLDLHTPDWHTLTGVTEIEHYVFDPIDPQTFYVYPPAAGTSPQLEIVYAASPTVVAAGENISIPDVYANALLDYIMYRAYSKDSDSTANAERAQRAYTQFAQSLGAKSAADGSVDNQKGTPSTVNG